MSQRPARVEPAGHATPHAELIAQLEARGPQLSLRALDRMYEDPFWWARFGERGRRFAEEDAAYHVQYLANALRLDSAESLIDYARWLQRVLTTRGMCTRHLVDDFGCLAAEITAAHARTEDSDGLRLTADVAPALAFLRAAQMSLVYADGPARSVQRASGTLVDSVLNTLECGDDARARNDVSHLVSYLADALALMRPTVFTDHVRWLADFCAREQGRPGDYVASLIRAMQLGLADAVDLPSLAAVQAVLTAATD